MQAVSASNREKPGRLRPEPLATPSCTDSTMQGLPNLSIRREAMIPTTPGCQFSPSSTKIRAASPFRLLFQAFQHLAEYRRLRRLPLDVELLDVLRQRRGLLPIGGQQQPGRRFGAAHPARRINPGGQGEHRCGSGHPLVSHPRDLHELGQSRPPALVHHLQPSAH